MTLKEWCDKHHEQPHTLPTGTVMLHVSAGSNARVELYHLDDYIVSSVFAGMTYLTPKEQAANLAATAIEQMMQSINNAKRCWKCDNCGVIDKVKVSVLRCVQQAVNEQRPADDAATVWNDMLQAYPCTGLEEAFRELCFGMARHCISEYHAATGNLVANTVPHELAGIIADFFRVD